VKKDNEVANLTQERTLIKLNKEKDLI